MKIKRKLKKIQMFILVIVMLSSYFIIIPKKVFAKESKYYYYSKNSSISAVGNELKGKYQGAPVKTIRLIRTEFKYKVTKNKETFVNLTETLSNYSYSEAKAQLNKTTYNGYPIVSKSMSPSVYNYGANEYKQYKVNYTYRYKVNEEQTSTTSWTTEKRKNPIDTRYYYEITTTSESPEILTDENGKKYKKTSYMSNGTVLEKTYIKDNGQTDYVEQYDKDSGRVLLKIEYGKDNKKVKETKYYEAPDLKFDYHVLYTITYDSNGKWKEKTCYERDGTEIFRMRNNENGIISAKYSNNGKESENCTFYLYESKNSDAPVSKLGWIRTYQERDGVEYYVLYYIEREDYSYQMVAVDDVEAYEKGENCNIIVREGDKLTDTSFFDEQYEEGLRKQSQIPVMSKCEYRYAAYKAVDENR